MEKPNVMLRLYEAYRKGKGIRLSANDVEELVDKDEAIQTRIANVIAGYTVGFGKEVATRKYTIAELKEIYNAGESDYVNSDVIRYNEVNANMYGCQPCPMCGSRYRASYIREGKRRIECDDCGYKQWANEEESDE
jgi:predicted RNA-binding Zn-ribbon protein involved in translation (DUF1610 family)